MANRIFIRGTMSILGTLKSCIQSTYSPSRQVHLSTWILALIYALLLMWIAVVTIASIAAVGYELVPVSANQFLSPNGLWYEKFIPKASKSQFNIPESRSCEGSFVKLGEGISTNTTSFFSYILLEYVDETPDSPVNGIIYKNESPKNCSIDMIKLTQPKSDAVRDQVHNISILLVT